jgi:hypothetical protein
MGNNRNIDLCVKCRFTLSEFCWVKTNKKHANYWHNNCKTRYNPGSKRKRQQNILFQLFKHARYIPVKLGGEESIVNAQLRLKQKQRKKWGSIDLFKSNLTLCVVCLFTLQTNEWCVHNRLFNANFENKFEWTPDTLYTSWLNVWLFCSNC